MMIKTNQKSLQFEIATVPEINRKIYRCQTLKNKSLDLNRMKFIKKIMASWFLQDFLNII